MLEILHNILEAAYTRFPPATPRPAPRGSAAERRVRKLVEQNDAERKRAEAEILLGRSRRPRTAKSKRRKQP